MYTHIPLNIMKSFSPSHSLYHNNINCKLYFPCRVQIKSTHFLLPTYLDKKVQTDRQTHTHTHTSRVSGVAIWFLNRTCDISLKSFGLISKLGNYIKEVSGNYIGTLNSP